MLICVYNVNVEAKTFNNLRVEGMMVAAVVGVRPAIGNPHSPFHLHLFLPIVWQDTSPALPSGGG